MHGRLLRPSETVLQGKVCTQTNHACLGCALAQYKLSMGRLLRRCACPSQPLLYAFALAVWAVVAKFGANGNCFRVTRRTGRRRPLSKYHGFFCGATGKTLSSLIPSTRHVVFVWNRTKTHAGKSFQICIGLTARAHPLQPLKGVGGTRALAHSIMAYSGNFMGILWLLWEFHGKMAQIIPGIS